MLRCQTFEAASSIMVVNGLHRGIIPENAGAKFGIQNYTFYIQNSSIELIDETLGIQQALFNETSNLPPEFLNNINARIFG